MLDTFDIPTSKADLEAKPLDKGIEAARHIINGCLSEDAKFRLECFRKLHIMAEIIGPASVRSELLPFLSSLNETNEDILVEMAQMLGNFVRFVGGIEYADCLFPMLTELSTDPNQEVKNAALKSLRSIIKALPSTLLIEFIKPYCMILANDKRENSRILSVEVIMMSLRRAIELKMSDTKFHLSHLYFTLCDDASPSVKHACAVNLSVYIEIIAIDAEAEEQIRCFQLIHKFISPLLFTDASRIAAVTATYVASLSFPKFAKPFGVDLILYLSVDPIWRVRWATAESLHKFASLLSADGFEELLFPVFRSFIRDSDANVQSIAIRRLPDVIQSLREPEAELVSISKELREEGDIVNASIHLRLAVLEAIIRLPTVISSTAAKDITLQFFSAMLIDEHYLVKCKLLEALPQLIDYIGVKPCLMELLGYAAQLAADTNWRVRAALYRYIRPFFDKRGQFWGTNNELGEALEDLFRVLVAGMFDSVKAVRRVAGESFCSIAAVEDTFWQQQRGFPILDRLRKDSRYALRIDFLYYISQWVNTLDPSILMAYAQLWLAEAVVDSVPNVRLNAVKAIACFHSRFKESFPDFGKNCQEWLSRLSLDTDKDVQYFSRRVLAGETGWTEYAFLDTSLF